mgnify:CR=1 FL=1
MYTDAVVGERNLQMVELAKAYGFAAKFTGSGGACLCLRRPGAAGIAAGADGRRALELTAADEEKARRAFAALGFVFVRVELDTSGESGGESTVLSALDGAKPPEIRGAVLQID